MWRAKAYLPGLITAAIFVALGLLSAGTTRYWQVWAYGAISVWMNIATRATLASNPELAQERARPGAGAQRWDKALLGIGLLLNIAVLVTAGVEYRLTGAARAAPPWTFIAGGMASLASIALVLAAMRENRFFSAVVRVQKERGHVVCTTGPYRFVRHPGNLGMIVGTLGIPLLLQSTWSALPATLSAVMLVVRTGLEDALLMKELDGYRAFSESTRFRLVPGLW